MSVDEQVERAKADIALRTALYQARRDQTPLDDELRRLGYRLWDRRNPFDRSKKMKILRDVEKQELQVDPRP